MPTEEAGWWERERSSFIRERVEALSGPGDLLIDIGCGRGTLLADDRLTDRVLVRVDSHVWDEWSPDTGPFVCADADRLPFRSGVFDVVGSFDVLEHLEHDEAALMEQRRIARPSGRVVTAVPADPRLWSSHDVAVGHRRRYTGEGLRDLGRRAGLRPTAVTHLFAYLWLPAWVFRGSDTRRDQTGAPAQGVIGAVVDRAIRAIARAERWVLRRWRLPLGTSLWAEWEQVR